ncbi:MAG: NAD(P)/FAD-dependent oxidoreductase [Bacteroidetes bacterium]|nr:NAD(P)/FAD-dependent oxidoreductase [Bacteroidota bacterium]
MNSVKKRIVIIGGGFAGINLAKRLSGNKWFDVIVVDKNNYYFFPPLVYQVATGFLDASSISYPFRRIFRGKKNIRFRFGELLRINPAAHTCYFPDGELMYDYLVFAAGAESNFFGIENVRQHAIPMKTVDDALNMRNRLLQVLEQACITEDKEKRKRLMTIVVAGGGPTGVEVSGMLAELRKNVLQKDYPELIGAEGGIYIVDTKPQLLTTMSEKSQSDTQNGLRELGVKIILNVAVKDFFEDEVLLSDGQRIQAATLIWTAGVAAKVFTGIPLTSLGAGRRIIVDAYNKVKGIDAVYAIGDICLQKTDSRFPDGHPQLAQVAIQHGKALADNFFSMASGKEPKPFHYFDKGVMAIMGRNKAVVDLPLLKLHFNGLIALFIWLFIHLMGLVNYRNKLRTFYNWTSAYFTRDQSLRMIIRPRK